MYYVVDDFLVYLWFRHPGGKDRQGRSILTIPAGKTEDLSVDQLGDTLSYLTQIPRFVLLFEYSPPL